MMNPVAVTRLEKAAIDNGFDLEQVRVDEWLAFHSTQTSLRIWLTAAGESLFLAALSRANVMEALGALGADSTATLPAGAAGARSVMDVPALHRLLRRVGGRHHRRTRDEAGPCLSFSR